MRGELEDMLAQRYAKHLPVLRRILGRLKILHLQTHTMSKRDVAAVESGSCDVTAMVQKYAKKYPRAFKLYSREIDSYIEILPYEKDRMQMRQRRQDVLFCWFAYGFTPSEYFCFKLGDKSPRERHEYISDRERKIIIYLVNDIFDIEVARNKSVTYDKLKKFYKRDAVAIRSDDDLRAFEAFAEKHPVFVQKNIRQNCGTGVKRVDFRQQSMTPEEYFKMLRKTDDYLIEELIVQSSEMSSFNSSSVNTVRCASFRNRSKDKVVFDMPHLRTGRKNSFIDNAAAGGVSAFVDMETGILLTDGYSEYLEDFPCHPETGVRFKGFQLPQWDELLAVVNELVEKNPTLCWVGWDLAHTDKGWVLVEANGRPQIIVQQMERGPLKKAVIDLLGIPLSKNMCAALHLPYDRVKPSGR